eukprot:1078410-Pyramimonas_sp.AAC.2
MKHASQRASPQPQTLRGAWPHRVHSIAVWADGAAARGWEDGGVVAWDDECSASSTSAPG